MILLPQLRGSYPPPLQAPRQQSSGDGESERASERAQEQQTKEKDADLPQALKNPSLVDEVVP